MCSLRQGLLGHQRGALASLTLTDMGTSSAFRPAQLFLVSAVTASHRPAGSGARSVNYFPVLTLEAAEVQIARWMLLILPFAPSGWWRT